MISIPSILLSNCVGSYFYSIINHLNREGETNGAMLYFARGNLKYREISIEDVKNKANSNPWGYQPVGIETSQGEILEIDNSFFDYLRENYRLKIDKYDASKCDFSNFLETVDNNTTFLVCTVDEFYLKKSDFYGTMHNKHFLLIKEIDYENKMLEVIDSERNFTYSLPFAEMESAVKDSCYKRKTVYFIDGSGYANDLRQKPADDLESRLNFGFIDEMIADVKKKYEESESDFKYFYKGYYYNILSKIVPYFYMCAEIFSADTEKYSMFRTIAKEWKNLSKFMYFMTYRHHEDANTLITKLEQIAQKIIEILQGETS
jgi:hypothetical protein